MTEAATVSASNISIAPAEDADAKVIVALWEKCELTRPWNDSKADLARWHDMNDVVHGVVAKHHGSISAEHGIGVLKRDELPHVKDPVALDIMRAIKATLDPLNILNPGKVL